jgi:hypothetical protein
MDIRPTPHSNYDRPGLDEVIANFRVKYGANIRPTTRTKTIYKKALNPQEAERERIMAKYGIGKNGTRTGI